MVIDTHKKDKYSLETKVFRVCLIDGVDLNEFEWIVCRC